MKEMYTSPELELLCLAPAERLASSEEIDFDKLLGEQGTGVSTDPNTDIDLELDLFK